MSGETEAQESGWTVDTLKYHMDERLRDMRVQLDERHRAAQDAVKAALASADKRLDSMNEFRQQLNDQTQTFLPRNEYHTAHEALEQRVSDLTDRLNRAEGSSAGVQMSAGVLLSVVTIAVISLGVIAAIISGR